MTSLPDPPDHWENRSVSEALKRCPVCGECFLELKSAKNHFWRDHNITVDESLMDDEDFLPDEE